MIALYCKFNAECRKQERQRVVIGPEARNDIVVADTLQKNPHIDPSLGLICMHPASCGHAGELLLLLAAAWDNFGD